MFEFYIFAAVLLAAGAALGILMAVCLGIRREERDFSFAADSTSRVARGARRLTGLSTRGPLLTSDAGHRQQNA